MSSNIRPNLPARSAPAASSTAPAAAPSAAPAAAPAAAAPASVAPPAAAVPAGDRYSGSAVVGPALPVRDAQADAVSIREARRARTADRMRDKVVELGWKELQKTHGAGGSVRVADGTAIGLRIEEKIYRPTDPAVAGDPLRKATTEALGAGGKDVLWMQTGGVLELGTGASGTVPLGGALQASGGFSASGLLRYSTTQPYALGLGQTPEDLLKNNTVRLPFGAEAARQMPGGSELELRGQGTVSVRSSVGAGAEAGAGAATLGASASVGASASHTGELGVRVQRLDGERVRVTLDDVSRSSAGLSAELRAGLQVDGAAAVPGSGEGSLASALQRGGAKGVEKLVERYASASAKAGATRSETDQTLRSFVLDLSKPEAAQAYEDLLRLSPVRAEELSAAPGSGVSLATLETSSKEASRDASVRFAGQKLLLYRALESERDGRITAADGQSRVWRGSKFEKDYSGIVSGDRKILWEGVTARPAEGGAPESFFRMRFEAEDKITTDSEVQELFGFGRALGIREDGTSQMQQPDLWGIAKLFSDRDDTRVKADIYFTRPGIEAIVSAGPEAARAAAFATAGDLDGALRGLPFQDPVKGAESRQMAERYLEARRRAMSDTRNSGGRSPEMRELERRYEGLTGRTDLYGDARALRQADAFAAAVGQLGAAGPGADEKWNALFAQLGKAQGFDYMHTIASLAKLAGPDQTLVHELSMQGEGVVLKSLDEGALEHPEAAARRELTREP